MRSRRLAVDGKWRFSRVVLTVVASMVWATVIVLGLGSMARVEADAYYPPSCVQSGWAPYHYPPHDQPWWENFCWLGTDGTRFINSANYVLGVQRELYYLGISVGPLDGLFGSQTKSGVQFFQLATGLSPDGIVGTNTWFYLMAYCPWHFSSTTYDYHWPTNNGYHGPDCFRHRKSDDKWQIWNLAGAWYAYFDKNGPN